LVTDTHNRPKLSPSGRCFGYAPPGPGQPESNIHTAFLPYEDLEFDEWKAVHNELYFASWRGPNWHALKSAGVTNARFRYMENEPGPILKRLVRTLRAGDTLVVVTATHLARSVHDLRRLRRRIDAKGATLTILWAGNYRNPTMGMCEEEIFRTCIERAKAAGRYVAGPGRPPRVDVQAVRKLKDAGLDNDAIATELDCDRSTVFRALRKLKAA
jgi:hypothetical protein